MVTDRTALIGETLRCMEGLYKARRGSCPREWLDVDLTMSQLKVLFFLYTDGPTRVTDIATSLGVTLPTVTTLLDRVEDRGLASRTSSPDDRRVVLCGLTGPGLELAECLWRVGRDRVRGVLERLSSDDLRQVAGAMRVLHKAARGLEQETLARI